MEFFYPHCAMFFRLQGMLAEAASGAPPARTFSREISLCNYGALLKGIYARKRSLHLWRARLIRGQRRGGGMAGAREAELPPHRAGAIAAVGRPGGVADANPNDPCLFSSWMSLQLCRETPPKIETYHEQTVSSSPCHAPARQKSYTVPRKPPFTLIPSSDWRLRRTPSVPASKCIFQP
jgi:hypothetical protein